MFEWDIQKAITNYEKHGVSFEEATTVFSDPNGLEMVKTLLIRNMSVAGNGSHNQSPIVFCW